MTAIEHLNSGCGINNPPELNMSISIDEDRNISYICNTCNQGVER
jgi:hypothetical protein